MDWVPSISPPTRCFNHPLPTVIIPLRQWPRVEGIPRGCVLRRGKLGTGKQHSPDMGSESKGPGHDLPPSMQHETSLVMLVWGHAQSDTEDRSSPARILFTRRKGAPVMLPQCWSSSQSTGTSCPAITKPRSSIRPPAGRVWYPKAAWHCSSRVPKPLQTRSIIVDSYMKSDMTNHLLSS